MTLPFADLSTETSLVPPPEGENEMPQVEAEYSFISEMFHMTHYALHLGFHVVHEKFKQVDQEIGRALGLYRYEYIMIMLLHVCVRVHDQCTCISINWYEYS